MSKTRSPYMQSRTDAGVGPLVLSDPRLFGAGNVFFVQSTHSNAGDSAGHGQTPDAPFATIDYAVGQCTADQGDVIIVLPGHVETVSSAGLLDLDVAGITIIGVGRGSKQPKIDLTTATTADVDVDAVNITLENFQIEASFADVAASIDVNSSGFTLRNCRFLEPVTDENQKICVTVATGASDVLIEGCDFYSVDAANTHGIKLEGTCNHIVIRNCKLMGVFETAAIGGAVIATNVAIHDNLINNVSADADECILLADTSTGVVCRNVVGNTLAADATTNINCGTTMTMAENYSTDKGDVQGVLDPVAT